MFLWGLPPLIVTVGEEPVSETNRSNDCSKQQHLSVETKPSKINANLLAIIFSLTENKRSISYAFISDTCLAADLILRVLPDAVNGLLLEKAEESRPVFVEVVSFTFTVDIFGFYPVSGLQA